MSVPSTNMVSKQYCPHCGGFNLVKLHRSFIQKRVLDSPNKLFCQKCEKVLTANDFKNNFAKAMPLFIDEAGTDVTAVAMTNESASSEESELIPEKSSFVDANPPIKKERTRLLSISLIGLFVFGGLSYVGYKYIIKKNVVTVKESDLSTYVSPKQEELSQQGSLKPFEDQTENESVFEGDESHEQLTVIGSASSEIVSPVTVQVVNVTEPLADVVETPQTLLSVPKLDYEVRIVLPLRSGREKESDDSKTKIGIKTTTIDEEKEYPLIEKAAIEFIKSDLDLIFKE